jgi:hypothetical protein
MSRDFSYSDLNLWDACRRLICVLLQSQSSSSSSLSEFTSLRVPAGGVPVTAKCRVYYLSDCPFPRYLLLMIPMTGKGGASLQHTSNAC